MKTTNIDAALSVGEVSGLLVALELAQLSREESTDIDYFIESLKAVIKNKQSE